MTPARGALTAFAVFLLTGAPTATASEALWALLRDGGQVVVMLLTPEGRGRFRVAGRLPPSGLP